MLQNQIRNNVSEFQVKFFKDQDIFQRLTGIFDNFLVCKAIQQLNSLKKKGFAPVNLLLLLMLIPFTLDKSVHGVLKSRLESFIAAEKDAFYRLKNMSEINWRRIVYSIFQRSQKVIRQNTSEEYEAQKDLIFKVNCLVFDDTTLPKTGFSIEGIGKVYDHVSSRFVLGFKMLLCCYWDGKCLNPIDFSLHSEKGKKKKGKAYHPYGLTGKQLKERYKKDRKPELPGAKRKQELLTSKIDVLLEMFKRALKHGLKPAYVLIDKWFTSDLVIKEIIRIGKKKVHVIAACKQDKRKYSHKGKDYTASELLALYKEAAKHCRSLKSLYLEVSAIYKGTPVKLFFNKPAKRKNWELLITTDLKLSFMNALKVYRLRWGIEVVFKEAKQHLLLGKCQSQDFDAQIADTAISLMCYIFLSQSKRFESYETLGEAFSNIQIFTLELTLGQRLWLLFIEICQMLMEFFEMEESVFMEKLFSNPEFEEMLSDFLHLKFTKQSSERERTDNAA